MAGPSNYPGGFLNGVTVQGIPIQVTNPGQVFWVYNGTALSAGCVGGSNGNRGTFTQPFATLDFAITQCVAGRGDIILMKSGHAETLSSATALRLQTEGVAIIGLGTGTDRPTFTLDTANTVTIPVSAEAISIQNVLFKANFLNIAALFTITTGSRFTTQNCEFRDGSAILNFVTIYSVGTVTNACTGLTATNNNWYGLGTAANSCFVNMAGSNRVLNLIGNYVTHAAVTGAGLMPIATGKVVTDAQILNNIINLVGSASLTTGIIITTDGTTNSGVIAGNFIQSLDATTEILVTASSGFKFFNNYYSGTADKSGYLLPAADA